jgi:hypothetical protein
MRKNDMCSSNTCDMYMCCLRHINDSVLSSLNMEGIRIPFFFFYCFSENSCASFISLRCRMSLILCWHLIQFLCWLIEYLLIEFLKLFCEPSLLHSVIAYAFRMIISHHKESLLKAAGMFSLCSKNSVCHWCRNSLLFSFKTFLVPSAIESNL